MIRMNLHELLSAVHDEFESAGLSPERASVSLAFVAKRDRNGATGVDFVDAGAMSKPRAEELHRLELSLTDRPQPRPSPKKEGAAAGTPPQGLFKTAEMIDQPPALRKGALPPSLPPGGE